MIEKIILDFLTEKLPVTVSMERLYNAGKYVLVEKTGGSKQDHIPTSTVAIQSYGPSLYEAAELNEMVKEAMEDLIELDQVTRSEYVSDYNYTNPKRKEYRYQAVYSITYYRR